MPATAPQMTPGGRYGARRWNHSQNCRRVCTGLWDALLAMRQPASGWSRLTNQLGSRTSADMPRRTASVVQRRGANPKGNRGSQPASYFFLPIGPVDIHQRTYERD